MENNNPKKLITHDGAFHSDDIFAAATIAIMLEKKGEAFEIIRTRDEKIMKTGDYVFDVGGIHDEEKNLFDHHQIGGAGRRLPAKDGEKGIEYAAFGLVWKKYGIELCGSQEAVDLIDKKLVAPIDAWDNGFDLVENKYETTPYYLQHLFFSMEPTWREETLNIDNMFIKSVGIAKEILIREVVQATDAILAEKIVTDLYTQAEDKRIIVVDKNYPFQYILQNFPEPLYVVYPRKTNGWWGVKAIRNDPKSFLNRKNLPKMWSGLRDEELQNVTGVRDAVFCHRALFMCVAQSKEGAIKLAQIAVES